MVTEQKAPAAPEASQKARIDWSGVTLDEVLCVQGDRVVGRDNCVSWPSRSRQIPEQHIAAIT